MASTKDEQNATQVRKGFVIIDQLIDESLKIESKRKKQIENVSEASLTISLKFRNYFEECIRNLENLKHKAVTFEPKYYFQ